jgi:hypothetical protein
LCDLSNATGVVHAIVITNITKVTAKGGRKEELDKKGTGNNQKQGRSNNIEKSMNLGTGQFNNALQHNRRQL